MLSLKKIFNFGDSKMNGHVGFSKDEMTKFLQLNPDKLAAFEKAYTAKIIVGQKISDNFFDVNSRQAAAMHAGEPHEEVDSLQLRTSVINRIVNELLTQAEVYVYENGQETVLQGDTEYLEVSITQKELNRIAINVRPQLTGYLVQKDIKEDSAGILLWYYSEHLKAIEQGDSKKAMQMYHQFRQGLDILDLDPVTYEVLGMNPNSMGYWLPKLVSAVQKQQFFKIPNTKVLKVPMSLLQLTRLEFSSLTMDTLAIANQFCKKVFDLDENKDYFIKTGTYSSKYDFRNCRVHEPKEVNELGEYLVYIQFQAQQMAGPLSHPCIYGVSTTNEWVVREFIEDKENNPCIYKGLPLHTEYRMFVDFDSDEILGINPYWDPKVMKKHFDNCDNADRASEMHNLHDYVTYNAHENTLMSRYEKNKDTVLAQIKSLISNVKLTGQWSIDVMQNGNDFYIIDMALAVNSALQECVPQGKLKPVRENWIPKIEG